MPKTTDPRHRLAVAALALLFAGCASSPSAPRAEAGEGAAASAETAPAAIPLEPYLGRLRTVDVELAGRERPFLFDTAGGVTLVTPEVAAEAGCEPFGRAVGFRHNGEPVSLERCRGLSLAIAGRETREDEVAVWDLMALLQGAPEVAGIVSLASFEGETITLDLGAGRLYREAGAGLPARLSGAKPLEIRAARQGGGGALDLFVAVESPKGPLWFELDSGALSPVLIAPHAAELLGLDLSPEEAATVSLSVAGLGAVEVVAQEKPDLIYDGLLNAAFLETIVLTVDLDDMRAWAAPRDR